MLVHVWMRELRRRWHRNRWRRRWIMRRRSATRQPQDIVRLGPDFSRQRQLMKLQELRVTHVTALTRACATEAGVDFRLVEALVAARIHAKGDISDDEVRAIAAECVVDVEDAVQHRG